jgi:hypothetical protein
MEFIGCHLSDQTEIRARMPKFGNIENTLNENIMENYDKKEKHNKNNDETSYTWKDLQAYQARNISAAETASLSKILWAGPSLVQ